MSALTLKADIDRGIEKPPSCQKRSCTCGECDTDFVCGALSATDRCFLSFGFK
jgi:hypothetical protein